MTDILETVLMLAAMVVLYVQLEKLYLKLWGLDQPPPVKAELPPRRKHRMRPSRYGRTMYHRGNKFVVNFIDIDEAIEIKERVN